MLINKNKPKHLGRTTLKHAAPMKERRRGLVFLSALSLLFVILSLNIWSSKNTVLRIRDWQSGEILIETPAIPGDKIYFGWIHSLENIPWNEYYYISNNLELILDTISFPAFGAGIPENRGRSIRIEEGLIFMYGIEDKFPHIKWLNSHEFTQDIRLNGKHLTSGNKLPENRLILSIDRRTLGVE